MANAKLKTEKTKYADMIFPDEKSVKNSEKIDAIEDAILDIDNTIAAARKAVRGYTKALDLARRTVPFSASRVLACGYDVEVAEENLQALQDLKEDLF